MIGNLAIVYHLKIEIDREKYIFVGHTFNFQETQKDILDKLKNNKHENIRLQKVYNLLIQQVDPQHLGLYFKFETLQALRQEYYPENVLPLVMEQLEKSFINTIREDYILKNKEYLILN